MKKQTIKITCQSLCREMLNRLNRPDLMDLVPGTNLRDGIVQLQPEVWLVATNVKGILTFWIMEGTTKDEAWDFFGNLHGGKVEYVNQRLEFSKPINAATSNN